MNDAQIIDLFGQVPYFADQVIEAFDYDPKNEDFAVSSYWAAKASLNLVDVCGTAHPDYAGLTWRDFLAKGKRMDSNLAEFRRNPAYYTDFVERSPSMYFHKIDGKTYITTDGHHRTAIGKFYLYGLNAPYIHGVSLLESQIDWRFAALYRRLEAVRPAFWRFAVKKVSLRREDGQGWKRDFFSLSLEGHNLRDNRRQTWTSEELEAELPRLEAAAEAARRPGLLSRLFNRTSKSSPCC